MKRWMWLTVISVAAIGLGVVLSVPRWKRSESAPPPPKRAAPGPVDALAARNRENLRAFLESLDRGVLALPAAPQAHAAARPAETREQMAELFVEAGGKIRDVGRMVNRDELRAEIIDRLLQRPGYLELATDVLADLGTARKLFGDQQALARVTALRTLRRAAEKGDASGLVQALKRLGERLNADAPWEKGIELDYEAVLAAYINYVGVDAFLANPEPVFALAGLSRKTSLEVRKGIYDSDARAMSPDELRARLGAYFTTN